VFCDLNNRILPAQGHFSLLRHTSLKITVNSGGRLGRPFTGLEINRDADDAAFEVQVASSGVVIRVAADQTVAAALAASGVNLPLSCEQGVCGTCLTGVLDGTPDHRDLYLTDDERARGDQFTPCCSRAKSPRLVLDL